MDKKRRDKTSLNTTDLKRKAACALKAISELTYTENKCGITSEHYEFKKTHGDGYFEYHYFDGVFLGIYDVVLQNDIEANAYFSQDFLELSFLIEGEQIIRIDGMDHDIVYESQDSYLVYLSQVNAKVSYYKRKHLKEVKIRLHTKFLKRHQLLDAYDILNTYALKHIKNALIKPLCSKTQDILLELIYDKRKGLPKRLFIESKALELLALKLDVATKGTTHYQTDHIIKKLYQIQHYIASNLATHYSIQDLSKKTGVNDFLLKKEFKRVFQQTIFEYAHNLRMKKAKQLLHHSTKPIYEISEAIGYKNATHFTAAFKKLEGITPKKYRGKI